MSLYRLLLLRRTSSAATTITSSHPLIVSLHRFSLSSPAAAAISPYPLLPQSRSFAFSSAEEAAAERRKRKRRLRIEPPLHAIQHNRGPPPPRDPNAPPLPDSTSALVGPRLSLHNRVQSLIRAFDLDAASFVARSAVYGRHRPTVFTCNAIIAAMYRAKRYNDAIALFKYFFEQHNIVPNVVSYNNLINTHCDEGRVDMALEVYRHIIATAPFSPSAVSYKHLTKGLIDAGRMQDAVDLLREMLAKGHGADSLVYNNVIKGFLELGNLEKANEFFDELKQRCAVYDGVVSATFMEWWFKQGKDKEAMECYKSLMDMKFRMVPATCNVLLEVLLKYGKKEVAWGLFEKMLDDHTPPTFQAVNSDTFNIMVNQCFKEGKFAEAIETFKKAGTHPKSRPFAMDVAGYNNIIARFCENEMMTEAEQFFAQLLSKSLTPDVTSFRTLIDAYLKLERIDDSLALFHRMVSTGLWVVASFGTRVFNELIKNGKAVESAEILLKMGDKDPKPDAMMYDVVVKGLCNAGAFDNSKAILEQMMGCGIGVPPALKEFVTSAFRNARKIEEIEKILDERRWENASGFPHTQQTTWRRPQMASGQPRGQFQTSGSVHFQMAREQPFGQNQIDPQAQAGHPQMTGQQPPGFQSMTRQQQPSGFQSMTGQSQPSGSQSMTGQQPFGTHQMARQQPPLSTQMGGQQPSWYSQMGGQQPSWYSQVGGHQMPGSHQMDGQQQSWSSRIGEQQTFRASDFSARVPFGASQSAGQGSTSVAGQHPTQLNGEQSLWSSQNGGKQLSQMNEQQTSHINGQVPFRSLKNAGQGSYSVSGQHASGPSQFAGQHQWQDHQQQFNPEAGQQSKGHPEVEGHNASEPFEWQHNNHRVAI